MFFARRQPFLFRPRVFSLALGCGARTGGAYTRYPTRPLGVQSHDELALFTGSLYAEPEPSRSIEIPIAVPMRFDFLASDFDPIAFADANLANRKSLPMRKNQMNYAY